LTADINFKFKRLGFCNILLIKCEWTQKDTIDLLPTQTAIDQFHIPTPISY
jgi:hypothetical protein